MIYRVFSCILNIFKTRLLTLHSAHSKLQNQRKCSTTNAFLYTTQTLLARLYTPDFTPQTLLPDFTPQTLLARLYSLTLLPQTLHPKIKLPRLYTPDFTP